MLRRGMFIALLSASVAACGGVPALHPISDIDAALYPEDNPEWNTVAALRNVDVCALLPHSELDKIQPDGVVGSSGSYGCVARMGTEDTGFVTVQWDIETSTISDLGKGHVRNVAGVEVQFLPDTAIFTPEELAGSPYRNCQSWTPLPPGGSLALRVDTDPGTDPCPLAESMVAVALSQWPDPPQLGSSPGTVRTALTGADPCDVAREFGIGRKGTGPGLATCSFPLYGERVILTYKYDSEPVAYESEHDGWHTYTLRAGPAIEFPALDGERVPVVQAYGKSRDGVTEVAHAAIDLLR